MVLFMLMLTSIDWGTGVWGSLTGAVDIMQLALLDMGVFLHPGQFIDYMVCIRNCVYFKMLGYDNM